MRVLWFGRWDPSVAGRSSGLVGYSTISLLLVLWRLGGSAEPMTAGRFFAGKGRRGAMVLRLGWGFRREEKVVFGQSW